MTDSKDTQKEIFASKVIDGLDAALAKLPSNLPAILFMGLLRQSLVNLRHYIGSGDPGVSWASPLAQLEYEIGHQQFSELVENETIELSAEDRKLLDKHLLSREEAEALAGRMTQQALNACLLALLRELTKNVFIIKKGKAATLHASQEIQAEYDRLPSNKRERYKKKITSGWGVGQLDEGGEPLGFYGMTDSAEKWRVNLIFTVHPLVIDTDEDRAFYPILVGLDFTEGNPARWADKEKADFWDGILKAVDDYTDVLRKDGGLLLTSEVQAPARVRPPVTTLISPGEWSPKRVPREVSRLLQLIGQARGLFSNYEKIPDLDPHGEAARAEAARLVAEGNKTGIAFDADGKPAGFQHENVKSYKALVLRTPEYRLVKSGREYIWRSYTTPGGHSFAVGFAWGGSAGALSDEWTRKTEKFWNAKRDEVIRKIAQLKREPGLFNDAEKLELEDLEGQVRQINRRLGEYKLYKRGQDLMELILNEVGANKTNLRIHLKEDLVKNVLWPGWHNSGLPENWRKETRQTLNSLVDARYMITGKMGNPYYERPYGPFLSLVADDEKRGGWIVNMTPEYLGALIVFAVGPDPRDEGKQSLLMDWNKKLTRDEKRRLKEEPTVPQSIRLTTLRNLRNWTTSQRALSSVLLQEITPHYEEKRSKKGLRYRDRVDNELGGHEELYRFEGKTYHGANGNRGNGYRVREWLTKVGCYTRRRGKRGSWEAYRTFLSDLRSVVVEALGGITDSPLKIFENTPPADGLGMKLKIYIPADREGRIRDALEKEAGLITPDNEAERLELEKEARHKRGEYTGKELQLARRMKGLTQAQLAEAWGIKRTRLTMIETEQRPIPAELTEKVRLFIEEMSQKSR